MFVKSFDTADRYFLECALGRLELPALVSYGLFRFSWGCPAPVQTSHWAGSCLDKGWERPPGVPSQYGFQEGLVLSH